ncbi:MAG: OmpA family protein, partial [Verrucomicrobiota bacterium]
IRDTGNVILVEGVVQTPQQAKAILDVIKANDRNADVRSTLKSDPFVTTPSWVSDFRGWWPSLLRSVDSPSLTFRGGQLSVEGKAKAEGTESRAEKLLVTAFGKDLQRKSFNIAASGMAPKAQPAQLSLANAKEEWILSGQVPTAEDKKRIVDAVRKTDPKVKDQILVVQGTTRPKWLSQFPDWWSKYREEVPEGTFAAEGDKEPSFGGRLANRGSGGNAANLLADVFGGKEMKFDWKMPTLKRPRLSLRRDANGVVLDGMVPTAKHRTDVENSVKKTEVKVTNRIAVDDSVDAPGWLENFGEWWPKLRKDIPDATFTLDGDNNSKIAGEADEATNRRVGSFLAGFFGSGIKLPKLETRMPAPTKSPWLSFKADKSSVVVSGEVADEGARQQLLASLSKLKGKVDSSGLRVTSNVKSESWTGNVGSYVAQLVAAGGPSTLNMRDGKAQVNATLPSESSRNEMVRSLGRIVGTGFRIENGLRVDSAPTIGGDSKLVLKDLLQGQRIYFPKNSSYFNSTERSKIQSFAKEITQLREGNITVYLIGHADARGQTDYNQWLSDKRANRVSRALSSYGVRASFVRVEAKGESDAAPLKAGESAWSKDRRVDIRVGKAQ